MRAYPLVVAASLFLLLFLVLTWPLVLSPGQSIVANHGDGFFDMLLFWYAGRGELLKPGVQAVFYPWGVALGPEAAYWLVPYMSVPLQWLMPLPAAFNLLCVIFFVASGVAMVALVRETGASRGGAFLAGCLLVLSPAYLSEMTAGILENMAMQWLILYLWCGLRLRRAFHWPMALAAAAFLALTWLTSWYLGAYALLFTLILPCRRLLPAVMIAALLVAAPVARAIGQGAVRGDRGYDSQVARGLLNGTVTIQPSTNAALVTPPTVEGTMRTLMESTDFSRLLARYRPSRMHDVLPGLLLLGLAGLGAWRAGRGSLAWIGMGITFLFLSMGPYCMWQGHGVMPLPTEWLYDHFDVMARLRPTRWMLAATLALCILAAHSLPRLPSRWARSGLIAALVGLQVFEVYMVQVARYRVSLASAVVPPYYAKLAADPAGGAVIDMPLFPYTVQVGQLVYYQTVHHHPMLNYHFVTVKAARRLEEQARRNSVLRLLTGGEGPIRRQDAEALAGLGFRHLLLHTRCTPPPGEPYESNLFSGAIYDRLCAIYGAPREDGSVLAFDMRHLETNAWTADGLLRDAGDRHGLVCENFVPWRLPDATKYTVSQVVAGGPCSELQTWAIGDVARIDVRQRGQLVGTASHRGARWDWLRIPLRRPDGRPVDPPTTAPLEISMELTAPLTEVGGVQLAQVRLRAADPLPARTEAPRPGSAPN